MRVAFLGNYFLFETAGVVSRMTNGSEASQVVTTYARLRKDVERWNRISGHR